MHGLFLSQGDTWKQQRRFTVNTPGNFGLGKSSMEDLLWQEAENFCEFISKRLVKPVQVQGLFNISMLNVLWKILTGDTFAYDDVPVSEHVILGN